ncbi:MULTISPECIES: RNA polymerase sigma factor RpoH [unclassified Bradyrhizobium]|uniref:RNA polymerase sigma factor RpoH n=1 Tax=unclassified Bradyrhizobium TaxID=2631580 RepID=UPI001FFB9618|nr:MULTISPECIES: RNA polymerase sigma factor RpoH [unclassified Bradyrhizobium]MCK1521732.1 RNA polymerase sigma factor RpoH [Bradyrhizobium sp. 17]MCK1684533.1 RNA polymerase sigma factor RpoH [Bradyrhizobium sp. 145]
MGSTATVPMLSSEGGLTHYLAEIRKFPMLRPDQEIAYAKLWREHGDREAAYHLVTSHLRLVARIAMGYRGYGLPVADIISEGNVGLMHAVKRFEPERGFRLATYAMWWIKASIQEYILRSWSLVRIANSGAQKKLFFKLRRTKAEISALEDGDLRPEHASRIARRLGVQENDVIEMNRRLGGDLSLNALVRDADGGEVQDWLVDPASSPEAAYAEQEETRRRREALAGAMGVLKPRERDILEARWLSEPPLRLEQLAARYGVSRERVRQIEMRAFEKVRAAIGGRLAAGS